MPNLKKNNAGFTPPQFSRGSANRKSATGSPKPVLMSSKSLKTGAGFTLIELLVVISIIGLLASVVLVALVSARSKARDSKRIADMNQVAKALELYYNDNNHYPSSTASVSAPGGLFNSTNAPGLAPRYLSQIPSAPTPSDNPSGTVVCNTIGRGGNNYWYEAPASGNYYTLTFCLGEAVGGTGGVQSGTRRLTPNGFQ